MTLSDFPITVNNKQACAKLMQAVESSFPKLLWEAGQKPTGFIPVASNFPIQVCLAAKRDYCRMYYRSRHWNERKFSYYN